MLGTACFELASGACLAEVGNEVMYLDSDSAKIETLKFGGSPIDELQAMRGMGFHYLPIGCQ